MGKRKTQEQFEKDVYERLGEDYKLLSPYPGSHGQVKMLHYPCGNEFLKNVHDIISKSSGCPYCNGAQPAKYNEQWVKEHTLAPYAYVKGYAGMKTKCWFYCSKCNTEFLQQPARLINQKIYGCNCCVTKKKTHKEFLEELGEKCLAEYSVLDEYINIDTKIRFQHLKCGTIFDIDPYHFIFRYKKIYCPICYYKKSKGEIVIAKFLTEHNILFHKEFVFPNLLNSRFDFYLPQYQIAIEYDGEQHFKAIEPWGGEEQLINTQNRDEIKNQYCIDNNIKLFRIPYYDFDLINQILYEIFEEKSSTTIEKYLVNIEQSSEQAQARETINLEDMV